MLPKNTKIWLLTLAVAVLSVPAFGQGYAVVVHPENDATVSKKDITSMFLGKLRKFARGDKATPVMQVEDNSASKAFMKSVIGKTWTGFRSYWSKRMFSGRGYPPKKLKSDADVKTFIANNKGAIGYISTDAVDESVKVVLRF